MKAKYSPVKVSIIIVLGLIFFIVFGTLYSNKTMLTKWLVCKSEGSYNETLKFKYYKTRMTKYYREEYLEFKSKSDLEKGLEYFNEKKSNLTLTDDFSYKISSKDFTITVKTYIKVESRENLFNNYVSDMDINSKSTIGEVRAFLEKNDYSCSVIRK